MSIRSVSSCRLRPHTAPNTGSMRGMRTLPVLPSMRARLASFNKRWARWRAYSRSALTSMVSGNPLTTVSPVPVGGWDVGELPGGLAQSAHHVFARAGRLQGAVQVQGHVLPAQSGDLLPVPEAAVKQVDDRGGRAGPFPVLRNRESGHPQPPPEVSNVSNPSKVSIGGGVMDSFASSCQTLRVFQAWLKAE